VHRTLKLLLEETTTQSYNNKSDSFPQQFYYFMQGVRLTYTQ